MVRAQRIAEDRERQRSKFGRVKPLWAIETKEDPNAKLMDQLNQCATASLRPLFLGQLSRVPLIACCLSCAQIRQARGARRECEAGQEGRG